ncbi:hypothetical protein N0V90_010256 [Kalmusia sp. IMI 367209]|nr:hypothetical protein N0V90_010256 [Kalmusia sp. IMI 367209]
MASNQEIFLAFDVYGTLLSTESIARQLAEHFGQEKAATIASEWRKYQLEYTWRLNSMEQYMPFSDVTRNSLKHALAEAGVSLDSGSIENLMDAYNTLNVFPDVPPVFQHLQDNPNIHAAVFSNGTSSMINASLTQSPDLSPYSKLFRKTVVVESVKRFKPYPGVYSHLLMELGRTGKGQEKDVWLWEGVGGWTGGWGSGQPTVIVEGLDEVVKKVTEFLQQQHE